MANKNSKEYEEYYFFHKAVVRLIWVKKDTEKCVYKKIEIQFVAMVAALLFV